MSAPEDSRRAQPLADPEEPSGSSPVSQPTSVHSASARVMSAVIQILPAAASLPDCWAGWFRCPRPLAAVILAEVAGPESRVQYMFETDQVHHPPPPIYAQVSTSERCKA